MKLLVCLIALLAISSVKADAPLSEDITSIFQGAWNLLKGNEAPEDSPTSTPEVKAEVKTEVQNEANVAPLPEADKQLKSINDSAGKLWNFIESAPHVPRLAKALGNKLLGIALNLDINNIQKVVDTAVQGAVASLPLSQKAKIEITQSINSITKPAINSSLVSKGINLIRAVAQIASVGLSIIIALGLALQNLVTGEIFNISQITKALPEAINEGKDILQTGLLELKSGPEHIIDTKQTAASPAFVHEWVDRESNEETQNNQPVKEVAYFFENYLQDVETKNPKVSEQANYRWIQPAVPLAVQPVPLNNQASLPVQTYVDRQPRQKLIPLTYHHVQSNYQESPHQPTVVPGNQKIHKNDRHHSPKPNVHNTQPNYQYDVTRNLDDRRLSNGVAASTADGGGISAATLVDGLFN